MRLHAEGAVVCVVDIDERRACELASALGTRAHAYRADVSQEAEVAHVFDAIRTDVGDTTVLANCAAYLQENGSVIDTSPTGWGCALSGTLTSAYLCARQVIPAMVEQR